MTLPIDSIPNSSGVSSVLNNLVSFCSTVLKNARPLSGSSHMVTSLIKPQMGTSLLSRTPPLLLAVGAFAVLGAVYLIATKIFRKQPPTPPPGDLTGRTAVVTPPPAPGSTGANGGADAGSLTPPATPGDLSGKTDVVTPPPAPGSTGANGGADAGSLTPTATPVDLSGKTDVVTPPPAPGLTGANGGADAGSLTPPATPGDLSGKTDAVTPSPVPGSAGTNCGVGAEPLIPPPAAPVESPSPIAGPAQPGSAPLLVTNSPTPPATTFSSPSLYITEDLLLREEPPFKEKQGLPDSTEPGHAAVVPHCLPDPRPLLARAAEPSSSNPSSQTSPGSDSPTRLPSSSEEDGGTSSGSETETENRPPTPPPASAVGRLVGTVNYYISTGRHFTKWTKYRLIQEQLEHFTRSKGVDLRKTEQGDSKVVSEITSAWNALIKALLEPTSFTTPDEQYRTTVECLRKTLQLLNFSDEATKKKFAGQLKFVEELSYVRFAGIELFPYCQQLIEQASEEPLPANLTLATFQTELKNRTKALERPAESTKMNPVAREANKARGTFNLDFDPLLKTSNIPYQDGLITANGRSTLILWHGTPVQQHDPYGLMFDLAAGALSYIPFVRILIPDSSPVSSPPVVNADYVAFIEEAARQGKNILHVILENGKKKRVGDESGRVKARLRLAVYHKNFFALALRLDGDFFERRDEYKGDKVESIRDLKTRLKNQLLMPIGNFENKDMTASTVTKKEMEDQLAANGFCVPKKLRDACELEKNIDVLLDEVQRIYFLGEEDIATQITTQEQHQAFLILSYVHIILFACWKMDVSILEALCKDDKDRGNVIKTILKLHFLYITGQINHETLTAVLTHVLARPFILQKAPIIDSRLVLIERVIPFIKAAHERVPVPPTMVFGKSVELNTASYVVAKPPGQTIRPNNATSRTVEEYQAFLENHQPIITPLQLNNWIKTLAQELCSGGLRQNTANYEKISEGLSQMLHKHLNGIFENRSLEISVKLDPKSLEVSLTKGIDPTRLKLNATFTISNGNVRYGSITASMTIMDHRIGQAEFEYSLIKG